MSGTPVLVQHIQEIEKVYRGLDGMSLIDLEVLVQAQMCIRDSIKEYDVYE